MVDARSRLFKVYSRRQDCNTNKATSVRPPPPPTPAPQELKEASRNREATGIELIPDERNVYLWTALIKGPKDTPFEGGTFELAITVPEQYPLVAPAVKYRTRIFHPNVHWKASLLRTGEICLDILKNAWSPAWTLSSVCQAIVALMSDPAPDSPLNCDAGNLLRSGDYRGYNSMARMLTCEHASR
ncbi:hypothetical protein CHLNCDRAFT_27560 [Chlorella variabilis]|uniref:UBC core domain-containing protein n=1 Tax=Chlorella variabilis TaxID=554065 RepID=E1ZQS2_CHLVA|nr:hypothetical protein CHLNCDRAFT_27560 [Chlorella variabilis]EFN51767.1 hypothetical protein CHLNCDRAFT_27560 [Chlorella variabilis]|eukprot:XP_005843869.1 hypothetical protein CHLNCDRAFT_27560 [Chlorella variabilis]